MNENKPDDWNPIESSVLQDQREAYDRMRERCPVAHSKFMGWSLFRHADIAAVLANTEIFRNASPFPAIPNGMDPPEHGLYRAALEPNFSPAALARLEPQLRAVALETLKPLLGAGKAEFMAAFVEPFVMKSQCEMLGWPHDQWQSLQDWAHRSQKAALEQDQQAGQLLAENFSALVQANLHRHRSASADSAANNATAVLLQTCINAAQLTEAQIVTVLRNWVAGQGTAAAGLGIVVLHLATNKEMQQRLRNDSSLIVGAVEEILRADGPLIANRRTVTEEVALGGRTIPKGEKLSLMWVAANRDPEVFDDPETVRIGRNTDASLVWGQGIHVCQGAALARMEIRIALEELLGRTQEFAIVGASPTRAVYPGNGPAALQLRLTV